MRKHEYGSGYGSNVVILASLIKTRIQHRDLCDKGVNLNDLLGRIARHSSLVRFLVRVWGRVLGH